MILSDLLTVMANNISVSITLLDEDGNALITFNAPGYGSIESDLGTRVVKRIQIKSAREVSVTIANAEP